MATTEQVTQFIAKIAPIIVKEAAARGYKFPSVIIAQAIIESNSGLSGLAKYHNYFGLKCGSSWKGASVNMKTKEEYQVGTLTTIRDNFRSYPTMEAGVKGYFDFISASRYNNLKEAKSAKQYVEFIKADGYATSSTYVSTVYSTAERYNLLRYDTDANYTTLIPVDPKIVERVLRGEMGTGATRVQNIMAAGYEPTSVQKKVNEICAYAKPVKEMRAKLGDYYPLIELI